MTGHARIYTVAPGDRLCDIAEKYYGDPRKIGPIWQANRQLIQDPNQLNIGVRLLIPHIHHLSFT
jgi:nucleoid-associated protein YgaU